MDPDVEAPRETLEELRREVERLETSRARLVRRGDGDRRRLERELHEGLQQHLVALAVELQRAARLASADPAATVALLGELEQDVQRALDDTAALAQRLHPPMLETAGLAVALRAAVARTHSRASIEVAADGRYPPDVLLTVHELWLETLSWADDGAQPTIRVREEGSALAFEVGVSRVRNADAGAGLEALRDRVEALGGRLAVRSEPEGALLASGSLPLAL